jgi:hypothetical protein
MRFSFATALLACVFTASFAQADPFGDIGDRFLTLKPGGSAPPSPYAYGGNKCEDVTPGEHVWWGRFAGGRSNGPSGNDASRIVHTTQGCFARARDCEAWMLALKTKYSAKPIYNQCRPGYEPGAPVPPWWAPHA